MPRDTKLAAKAGTTDSLQESIPSPSRAGLIRKTAVGLAFAGTLLASASVREAASDKPNIVVILADDLGYGDLGSYGATHVRTPNIDSLATQGVLLTDAHTHASTCTPTRYGLLTGRYSWRTWLKYSALSTDGPLLIEEGRMTLASLLKSAGYNTSIVGKWHLGFGREDDFARDRQGPPNYWRSRTGGPDWNGELKPGPLEVGFDFYYGIPVANSFPPYVLVRNRRVDGLRDGSPIGTMDSKNNGKMEGGEGARWRDEDLADQLTAVAVDQLEELAAQRQPFFLYYAPHQLHIPNKPNARFRGTSLIGARGDCIHELDWSVGELLAALDRLGLKERTLVIFTSDNGASRTSEDGHRPMGPLMQGRKGDLYEGGHRVPFLARWPGKIKPGISSAEMISLNDMLATIAALTGQELPPSASPDSFDVLPALLGQVLHAPLRPSLVMTAGGTGKLAIREGKWKLIDGQGSFGYAHSREKEKKPASADSEGQLYDMEKDLGERTNLYKQRPEIVQRLRDLLQAIKDEGRSRPL